MWRGFASLIIYGPSLSEYGERDKVSAATQSEEKTREKSARTIRRSGRCTGWCSGRRYRGRQKDGGPCMRSMSWHERRERERNDSQPRRPTVELPHGAAEGVQRRYP